MEMYLFKIPIIIKFDNLANLTVFLPSDASRGFCGINRS